MAKRFGRPAPAFEDENAESHIVRRIRMTREGSGIEDVYQSVAALDAMHASSAEAARKRAIYDGVLHWLILLVFWVAVFYAAAQFLRNLH